MIPKLMFYVSSNERDLNFVRYLQLLTPPTGERWRNKSSSEDLFKCYMQMHRLRVIEVTAIGGVPDARRSRMILAHI